MAVPLHGGHRPRHVLSRAPATPAAACAAACAAIVLAACGGGADDAPEPGAGGDPDAAVAVELEPLLAALGDRGGAAAPPRWPDDLGSHPDAPFEAREWLAVLRDEGGEVLGLRQRFVRAVPEAPVATPDGDATPGARPDSASGASPWRYAAVLRVDGALERPGVAPERWSLTEREAVGLGALDAGPGFALELLGHSLASLDPVPAEGCDTRWRLVVPDVARLEGSSRGCPTGGVAAGTAAATQGAFAVRGTLADGARTVSGVAWQRLAWGTPPALGGGAVTFDRAVLALEGIGALELLRSRRASGRGVPRTTATALDARARGTGLVEGLALEWLDRADDGDGDGDGDGDRGGDASTGAPTDLDAGRLRVPALGIDVALRALSPVVAEDDGLERAFRGAVIASGTHRGVGFVERRPMPAVRSAAGRNDRDDRGEASG